MTESPTKRRIASLAYSLPLAALTLCLLTGCHKASEETATVAGGPAATIGQPSSTSDTGVAAGQQTAPLSPAAQHYQGAIQEMKNKGQVPYGHNSQLVK